MQSGWEDAGSWPHRSDAVWPQRSELLAALADETGSEGLSPSRHDTRKATRVFELVGRPEAAAAPATHSHARLAAALAGALGVVVGLLLALLLAHTAFAPDSGCSAGAKSVSSCARAAR